MTLAEVFQYLVLFAAAVWTARLAISKGRNAWVWGGSALLLGLLPWHLLGMVPVLVLLFIKTPSTSPAAQPDRLTCPRCAKPHSGGQHFCTGCGWDLSMAYSPEEPERTQVSSTQTSNQAQAPSPSTAAAEPPKAAKVPDTEALTVESPVPASPVSETTAVEDGIGEPVSETAQPAGAVVAEEEEPERPSVPWGAYQPNVAPTAAVMTARGIERFNEGKYQEAIDQFTKAIALDSNYAEAWQRRAEAYAQLGRSEQAAEDRRHLQGLDPSSSPG